MSYILFIINDAPYGNERAHNALRLAGAIAAKEDANVRVFLMADAVGCAKDHQKVPEGYYNTQLMLSKIVRKGDVGHTMDSMCLLVSDARRGPEPWFVITGDTLFVGAVGRPDLAGREQEMAGLLHDSLHEKILILPNELEIFPGHQAGSACGVGLSGKPSSTVGFEKRWTPALSMDRDAFVRDLTANIPPRPTNMDQIVATNIAA